MHPLRNRYLFLLDVFLLVVAVYFSFMLRLEKLDIAPFWLGCGVMAVVAVTVIPFVFAISGIYSRYWRYASVDELVLLVGASTIGVIIVSLVSMIAVYADVLPIYIPRSVPFIFLLLVLAMTTGTRLLLRVASGISLKYKSSRAELTNVGVMGAGYAGAMIVRELQRNPQLGMRAVVFFDDDLGKHDVRIHNVPVLGGRNSIPAQSARLHIGKVIIAMPTAQGEEIREIVGICERAGVKTKIVPGMNEVIEGTVSVNQLRDVEIEDLLRRQPVHTDIEAVRDLVRGKVVLVTGGGGSIGSELCRQLIRCHPESLVLLGHGENSIFEISNELKALSENSSATQGDSPVAYIRPIVADIRFPERVSAIFEEVRPDIVFHAAAHKHVPLMEANPSEAITNNVFGTRNLLWAAMETDVDRFVMISTDKAVNPTSIMGASKRVAELLVHDVATRTGKPYVAVRFGNVLGSRGSVLLTFEKQIANGGPITVTHPDMNRYFMTIPEAVELVLQASVLGSGGEVFVLDMGEPVKIVDLARDLIELSGLEEGKDIDIVFSGMRDGEKMFEELFAPGEDYNRTRHEKIYIAANASSVVPDDLQGGIDKVEHASTSSDRQSVIKALKNLVPEYQPYAAPPEAQEQLLMQSGFEPEAIKASWVLPEQNAL